ncbi:hypothetical protein [Allocoleopsis sp.]|uniref:hypothetical protein n=1 Tax=Allocoleopsis sp. TaxID=3088169 RepID=UPI002FD00718
MRIKIFSHLIIGGSLLAIFISKGEVLRATVQEGSTISTNQTTASSESRQLREQAKNARRFSKVALERLKSNCIQTVDAKTRKDGYYIEGEMVLDNQLKRPLRPGVFICNSLGETATIAEDGSISSIVRVALNEKQEYDKLFSQIKGASKNGGSRKVNKQK